MKLRILTILLPILMACTAVDASAEEDTILIKQVSEVLKEVEKLKVGMNREDLMKIFTAEGGISTATQRTFAHRHCPLIKVDVQFALAENQDILEERDSDKISRISKPYLAWPVID